MSSLLVASLLITVRADGMLRVEYVEQRKYHLLLWNSYELDWRTGPKRRDENSRPDLYAEKLFQSFRTETLKNIRIINQGQCLFFVPQS